jgi:hypothetical protein
MINITCILCPETNAIAYSDSSMPVAKTTFRVRNFLEFLDIMTSIALMRVFSPRLALWLQENCCSRALFRAWTLESLCRDFACSEEALTCASGSEPIGCHLYAVVG